MAPAHSSPCFLQRGLCVELDICLSSVANLVGEPLGGSWELVGGHLSVELRGPIACRIVGGADVKPEGPASDGWQPLELCRAPSLHSVALQAHRAKQWGDIAVFPTFDALLAWAQLKMMSA